MTEHNQPGHDAANEPRGGSARELEAEIDQTRNAISGDLRTLGERLDPAHLKEEAKEVIVEAKNVAVETLHEAKNVATSAFREAKDTAMSAVNEQVEGLRENVRVAEREAMSFLRANAVPLALLGIGVSWLVANRKSRERRWDGHDRGDRDWAYPPEPRRRFLDDGRHRASGVAEGAREAAGNATDRAASWVEEKGQQARGAVDDVRGYARRELEHAGQSARHAGERISETAGRAQDYAGRELRHARDYGRHMADAHPLAIGAAAIAAGIGVGLVLPSTPPEQRLLGETKERLFEDAKGAARDLAHTAKHTAREVKETLSGSTPS